MGSVMVHEVSQPIVSQKVSPRAQHAPLLQNLVGLVQVATHTCPGPLLGSMKMAATGVAICMSHYITNLFSIDGCQT